jgi:hypothetical protein
MMARGKDKLKKMRDYFPKTNFTHQNYIVWVNLNVHLEGIKLTVVLQNLACTVANLYCRITQKWHGKNTSI